MHVDGFESTQRHVYAEQTYTNKNRGSRPRSRSKEPSARELQAGSNLFSEPIARHFSRRIKSQTDGVARPALAPTCLRARSGARAFKHPSLRGEDVVKCRVTGRRFRGRFPSVGDWLFATLSQQPPGKVETIRTAD